MAEPALYWRRNAKRLMQGRANRAASILLLLEGPSYARLCGGPIYREPNRLSYRGIGDGRRTVAAPSYRRRRLQRYVRAAQGTCSDPWHRPSRHLAYGTSRLGTSDGYHSGRIACG